MAGEGYPGPYERGHRIRGLKEAANVPNVKVFHAGTCTKEGQIVSNGGRVLGVTALGNTISAAKLQAYTAVKCSWDGAGAVKTSPIKRCCSHPRERAPIPRLALNAIPTYTCGMATSVVQPAESIPVAPRHALPMRLWLALPDWFFRFAGATFFFRTSF